MKIKISVILLFLAGILSAQENYMSISFGTGTPLGDFSNTSSLATDGYAAQGFMAEYSFGYYPIDYLGAGGSVKFIQNGVYKDELSDALLALLPDNPGVIIENPVFDVGLWRIVAIGVGPQLSLPTGKFCFDLHFYPGMHIVMPPQMALTAIVDEQPTKYSLDSQSLRFGFETGFAIQFKMSESASLRLSSSYLQTSAKGEIKSKVSEGTENTEVEVTSKIQLINVGIGIAYRL